VFCLNAQDDVFTIAKVMPEFPGGTDGLATYMYSNIRYSSEAGEAKSGKSYVNFIVDTMGKVQSAKIIKSSGNKYFDDEALRVVNAMPNWTPGSDSVRKVKVQMNLPISFKDLGVVSSKDLENKNNPEKELTLEEKQKQEVEKKAMKFYDLGRTASRDERYESALSKFDSCLKYLPEHKGALLNKAAMHYKLDQKKLECSTLNKIILLYPNDKEVEEILKKHCN
jgi:TonB family protein